MTENFVDREFREVLGGYYENDFYYTPNGSNLKKSLTKIIYRLLGC